MDLDRICLNAEALDALMPLHAILDQEGVVRHVGPTLAKVLGDREGIGERFLKLFEIRRPRFDVMMARLAAGITGKVSLRLRDDPDTQFIGTALQIPNGGGILVNLSFGIATFDAVRIHKLAGSDFAPTDLTLELLFVAESNAAALEESRGLNERLRGAKQRAETQATTDPLTGLQNRRAFDRSLNRLIGRQTPFGLAHVDLDFFKAVNDTQGHAAGDHVLQVVAKVLRDETRELDVVARVGGDEFVILFPHLAEREKLASISARIIEQLEQPIPFEDTTCRISASIGIVTSAEYTAPIAEEMLANADAALYASKSRGRAQFTFYDELSHSGEKPAAE